MKSKLPFTRSTSGRTRHNRGDQDAAFISEKAWSSPQPTSSARQTKPSVRIAGMDLPALAIKESNFERDDLTLLSIDEQKLPIYMRMRRTPAV
jgi:hypothetical protein